MVHAFIMVKAGAGEAQNVRERLLEFEGLAEAHVVAGQYDVIAEVNGTEVQEVLNTVSDRIGAADGVTDTKTYISLSAA